MNLLIRVLIAVFITVCVSQSSSLAVKSKKSYIVYLGGINQELEASQIKDSHFEFLGSILGSKERVDEALIYSYNKQFNGFAALLDEEDAAKLAEHPDVVTVIQNKGRKLHTTHSWDFLKLEKNGVIGSSSLWTKAKFGENIIIANLDTGVWHESKSFNDYGYGPIPSKWKGGCENETLVPCNNKLIGAKYYNKGFQARYGKLNSSMNTAHDHEGHGSHTLSTAGGNFVPGVSINGLGTGTAKGGSPRARVAAYKVCWPPTLLGGQCDDADIVKAFESAIHDGADVISISLGGPPAEYMNDGLAIASFHAVKKGITVVFSAGNDGPTPGSVTNLAPWAITVGATTTDREFQSFVDLANELNLKGLSMSKPLPHSGFYPLINAANAKAENASMMNATLCAEGALDPKKVEGKILVCLRGGNVGRVEKGVVAASAGAAGMILCNAEADGEELIADPHVLPATHITYADGLRLFAYLNSTNEPLGYITQPETALNIKPAPFMAGFSSRGPNTITPEILKPDITAPGVNIIAAYSENEDPVLPYNILSGTSMSCPHVAGVVGLLKSIHPDWSPAAIKSAIMTTANIKDNNGSPMLDENKNEANPFSRGAGDIDPNRAMNPGLVYDSTVNDYLDFLCTRGYNKSIIQKFSDHPYQCPENNSILDFNYPSITVHKLNGTVTVTRRLTNVGPPGMYTVRVKSPAGISVDVKPNILVFEKKGEVQKFELTMKADGTSVIRDYVFGELIWFNGKHYHVKSPIVVSVA
ncbi:putative tripeptidyl-peptidase II [Helianthus annuus]|uniref:Tripeptidyl-peptidase II n=1 Tax=Helianthus annuus TaxID=4232 RepID=A0A9K3JT62_HELAN|nr:subtilisin-like protease SBT5.4 [Helianthus annuus]KAF5820964.1 putative tripeptidyl-peptidase II [Helianthus annuus]